MRPGWRADHTGPLPRGGGKPPGRLGDECNASRADRGALNTLRPPPMNRRSCYLWLIEANFCLDCKRTFIPSCRPLAIHCDLPRDWTPDQALAVVELLDDLSERITASSACPLSESLRKRQGSGTLDDDAADGMPFLSSDTASPEDQGEFTAGLAITGNPKAGSPFWPYRKPCGQPSKGQAVALLCW